MDVRLVALAKFIFIVLSSAHWMGAIYFLLAAWSGFESSTLRMQWVTQWTRNNFVDFRWNTASQLYTYLALLFKGFTMLTNLGYADAVCSSLEA
jgi:cytochrome b subunit of formate dehydrogenase